MSRLALMLTLTVALAAACAPRAEPRTIIASAGARVIFEDDLRAPHNWPAAQGENSGR